VAYRQVPGQSWEVVFGEALGDEAHRGVDADLVAVAGGDPDAFLATVLEGVQTEERDSGHVFAG
jgi:hypothetical protein